MGGTGMDPTSSKTLWDTPDPKAHSSLDPALQGLLAQASGQLSGMFNNPLGAVGPRQVLGETPQEQAMRESSISNLQGAIPGAGQFSQNENTAQSFLGNTLRGDYLNPTTSPAFQAIADAIRRGGMESSQLAGDQLNANFAGGGQFGGSSALLGERSKLAERTGLGVSDQLAQYAMPLYSQALGYQQNAVPQSMAFGNLGRSLPMNQLNMANQAYGLAGIPRATDQMRLDEVFNAAQRARSAQLEPFQLLSGLMGGTPAANTTVDQNDWSKYLLPLISGVLGGVSGLGRSSGSAGKTA